MSRTPDPSAGIAVLLNKAKGKAMIDRIAKRILAAFDEYPVIQGEPTPIGASIGIAVGKPEFKSADEIIRKADSAMYHIKLAKKR
jgi:GGDEF domain-containing protein